jgi:hypothetical protein
VVDYCLVSLDVRVVEHWEFCGEDYMSHYEDDLCVSEEGSRVPDPSVLM